MANAKIRLLKQVKLNKTWSKCPVVVGKDGKHKLSRVVVDGIEQEHPNGVYHLDYRVSSVRKPVSVQSVLEATGRKGFNPTNIGATEIKLAINNIEHHLEGFKNGDAEDLRRANSNTMEQPELHSRLTPSLPWTHSRADESCRGSH
jgi:hypothetical protein